MKSRELLPAYAETSFYYGNIRFSAGPFISGIKGYLEEVAPEKLKPLLAQFRQDQLASLLALSMVLYSSSADWRYATLAASTLYLSAECGADGTLKKFFCPKGRTSGGAGTGFKQLHGTF
jgi:hypothetical protein